MLLKYDGIKLQITACLWIEKLFSVCWKYSSFELFIHLFLLHTRIFLNQLDIGNLFIFWASLVGPNSSDSSTVKWQTASYDIVMHLDNCAFALYLCLLGVDKQYAYRWMYSFWRHWWMRAGEKSISLSFQVLITCSGEFRVSGHVLEARMWGSVKMFRSVLLNVCDNGVLLALCGFGRECIEA